MSVKQTNKTTRELLARNENFHIFYHCQVISEINQEAVKTKVNYNNVKS